MKGKLTFPLITIIGKPLRVALLLITCSIVTLMLLFPESPPQITLIDHNKQHYLANCPILVKRHLTTEQKALPHRFTLLNWNIYKQQKQDWRKELQKWTTAADLITLQEAKLSTELIDFAKQNDLFYLQNYAFKHNDQLFGVNTLSNIKATSACGSATNEPWIRIPKTALATTYPMQGSETPLLVINLHGINFTFTEKPLLQQLSPYLKLIEQHNGPAIFSGDFNTWNDARLKMVEQVIKKLGLSEVLFSEDNRLTAFALPLDHIYFRGLEVIQAQSITTNASDHTPQLITFAIK